MTSLDLLNLDVLLARSVLLRADYMRVQTRINDLLSHGCSDAGDGPEDEDFSQLIRAMSRSFAADARYLSSLSYTVHEIIEHAKATA